MCIIKKTGIIIVYLLKFVNSYNLEQSNEFGKYWNSQKKKMPRLSIRIDK